MDRRTAGILGVTTKSVGEAMTSATSSSRYVLPVFWADRKSGIAYQIQAEVPLPNMNTLDKVRRIGVETPFRASIPLHRFATVVSTTTVGQYDRLNMSRMVSVAAEIYGEDLGRAARRVKGVLKRIESQRPRGVFLSLRGQVPPMENLFSGLSVGLVLAIVVVFLVLSANFQSLRVALIILVSIPAVLGGAGTLLMIMGSTLNIQSFMGMIMAVGVAIANAIILISFAEQHRMAGIQAPEAAIKAAFSRMRPILMTASAMIAGMIPMASGLETSARQMAPLAQSVIGGLSMATAATLFILPLAYAAMQTAAPGETTSLDPDEVRHSVERSLETTGEEPRLAVR